MGVRKEKKKSSKKISSYYRVLLYSITQDNHTMFFENQLDFDVIHRMSLLAKSRGVCVFNRIVIG
jgi:hypothetical protein